MWPFISYFPLHSEHALSVLFGLVSLGVVLRQPPNEQLHSKSMLEK